MRQLLYLGLAILLTGCQKTFLGEEPSADPVETFETLWKDFDEHYALFEVKKIDWDELYSVYRPKVSSTISQDSLWNVTCALLGHFKDSHVSIYEPDSRIRYFNANQEKLNAWWTYDQFAVEEFLSSRTATFLAPELCWGEIRNRKIGYIWVGSFLHSDYEISDLDKLVGQVSDMEAIIVDVRNNGGGDPSYAWRLSSWFSDNTHNVLFTQTRNGPSHGDFAQRLEHRNFQREDNLSSKPVVVLTSSTTVSAGEWFTLSMKTFGNVTQIGGITSGAYSNRSSSRFLPNGWVYNYSIVKVTLPDGTSPEGVGCIPDILVENDPDNFVEDKILIKALEYLNQRYGI